MSSVSELKPLVDDIFSTLEDVKKLFERWDSSCKAPFIDRVMHMNTLSERLNTLGYADDFVDELIKVAYSNVFSNP